MQLCVNAGDAADETGLAADKNYDLLGACTATKCEVICLGDLIPDGMATQCVCPVGLTESWNMVTSLWECI